MPDALCRASAGSRLHANAEIGFPGRQWPGIMWKFVPAGTQSRMTPADRKEIWMRVLFTLKHRWLLILAAGGGLFLLEGCDPTVRDTLLTGFGNATTGLIGAFVQALIQQLQANDVTQPATTVRAILDTVPQFFA